jgi:N-acetylglutamate synthase-like GNAT family acetyltransferase/SAM-dependent methyltransferase
MTTKIETLAPHHLEAVKNLLAAVRLPEVGREDAPSLDFVVAVSEGIVVGCAGVEVHADQGLLRSVAVHPSHRGHGIGDTLVLDRVHWARARGLAALHAVTLIPSYFERLGFVRTRRSDAPAELLSTPTFQGLCPDTATLLVVSLEGSGPSLVSAVREKYGSYARRAGANVAESVSASTSCCGEAPSCSSSVTTGNYDAAAVGELPEGVVSSSLGCGSPTLLAALSPGETVLDLGSGAGLDLLLASREVGSLGKVYGLDMTGEMLELARRNIRKAGATNVELLEGQMESIPLPDEAVDVVLSNCVINLSTDKRKVLREIHRVLRPGGRVAVSDIVVFGRLPEKVRRNAELWAGCVAGALDTREYRALLGGAGFTDIVVEPTRFHDTDTDTGTETGQIASASVQARKPVAGCC